MTDLAMPISGLILIVTLIVFALGKSPVFRVDRAGVAIVGATLTVAFGVLTFDQATRVIEYRTLVLLFAMMIITANLKLSGFFQVVGNFLIRRFSTQQGLLFGIILASGFLSALFINDIICLLLTPIVLMFCKRAKIQAMPYLLAIATASNIGSAATLLGNPQNIFIGSLSKLPFLTYTKVALPIVVVGLLINYAIIAWIYRDQLQPALPETETLSGVTHPYLMKKTLLVTALILVGFMLTPQPAIVASLGAAYLLITRRVKPNKVYTSIDFNLLVMFIGLFIVIGGVEHSGLAEWMMKQLQFVDFGNFSVFALVTVGLSNVVSNVPAVLLLKSYIPLSEAQNWWIGMGVFSTVAGNLTLAGSIANLIVAEIAKREGVKISFTGYLQVGLPLTVILVVLALIYFHLLT